MSDRVRAKRIKIPKAMVEAFIKEPMVIFPIEPAGLWPMPPELLANPDLMNEMISDKEFQLNYDIVIVPK